MRPSDNFPLVVLATAALAVVIVALPLLYLTRDTSPATPQGPFVEAIPVNVRMIPEVDAERSTEINAEVAVLIEDLYRRAFQPAEPNGEVADAVSDLGPFFADEAAAALLENPDVFDFRELLFTKARITFEGVTTLADTDTPQALVELKVRAEAYGGATSSPPLAVRHDGTMRLEKSEQTWRIIGFDLALSVVEAEAGR